MVLRTDTESQGGIQHLPPVIILGSHRGFTKYHGQLKKCSTCGDDAFLSMNCPQHICFELGGRGHRAAECEQAQKCN